MKLICTRCDGLGAIRVKCANIDPLHNVAQYTAIIDADGERHQAFPMSYNSLPVWPFQAYEKPCLCDDGFIEWTRGASLVPLIHKSKKPARP